MSSDCPDTPYINFVGGLASKLALAPGEADALIRSLLDTPHYTPADPLDHSELLLAVSLNAQLCDAQEDARFKKLKFLLRNNNSRAIKIATQWVEHKISFEAMLMAV